VFIPAICSIPPTQREFTATGITIFRLADGKVVERWVEMDMLGALQQLGVIPEDQTRV
jgi:predicted ester cyclase